MEPNQVQVQVQAQARTRRGRPRNRSWDQRGRAGELASFFCSTRLLYGWITDCSSALLGMLPPPKRKINNTTRAGLAVNKSMAKTPSTTGPGATSTSSAAPAPKPTAAADDDDEEDDTTSNGLLLPSSIARNKAKAKAAAPIDLFGLSTSYFPFVFRVVP